MIEADLVIAGAGAAGLTAAIAAAEAAGGGRRIVLIDGAKRPGAKILVSGGGRCNVTNARVTPEDYCGGPQPMIRSVLRGFDHRSAAEWMRSLGVQLKEEDKGKMFPVTDRARTVLDALLRRVEQLGVELHAGVRLMDVQPAAEGFELQVSGGDGPYRARRLILATGGQAMPRTGSDGAAFALAERLGHQLVPLTPALVPLVLASDRSPGGRLRQLSGLSVEARLSLVEANGRCLFETVGDVLFTHIGLSGPAVLDISRHWLRYRLEHPGGGAQLCLGHPDFTTPELAEAWLLKQAAAHPKRGVARTLTGLFPERLADLLAAPDSPLSQLTRERRRELALGLSRLPLPVTGDRGWAEAEVTAGGVDLRQVDPRTMASRIRPGLFLCGEMLDVDGRIGGFNFQWAWASGHVAGRGAALSLDAAAA